jgi:predicted transcriptional regulator
MTERERLHALVDDLPEEKVHAVLRLVEYLRNPEEDPVLRALRDAPPDDEPITQEDLAAIEEAEEDVRQGRLIPHEEVCRRLGEE